LKLVSLRNLDQFSFSYLEMRRFSSINQMFLSLFDVSNAFIS